MKVANFTTFEPFNILRNRMGADRLGYFELFDPARHLTGSERSELSSTGRLLALEDMKVLPDKTLSFKNSRVLIYYPHVDHCNENATLQNYHVANCSLLEQKAKDDPTEKWLATTKIGESYALHSHGAREEFSLVTRRLQVCRHCLHRLRYKNYDEFRNRRRGYSEKVLSSFSLAAFFKLYPQYPLGFKAKREDVS